MKFLGHLVVLTFVLAAQVGVACSVRPIERQVTSPEFKVVVKHRTVPVAGIMVEITPEEKDEAVLAAATDKDGVVQIRGLAPGRYTVQASHGGVIAGKEWIEVDATATSNVHRQFDFEWADWSYQTRRVAGTLSGLTPGNTGNKLMDLVHPQRTVYPGVSVVLRNAFGAEEYKTLTDSSGVFMFNEVPDGIYTLHIDGGMKSLGQEAGETLLVLDVSQKAPVEFLPLELKDSGCHQSEFELAATQAAR